MGRMIQNLDKAQKRSSYKIQGNAPEAGSLRQSNRQFETPQKLNMRLKVANPVTKGDKSSGRSNAYESGRMDKSRS